MIDKIKLFWRICAHVILKKRYPFSVSFLITHRCNLRCSYCNSYKQIEDEMTTEQIKKMLTKLKNMGLIRLGITGGEPLLREDIGEIISFAKSLGIKTTLVTNGSLVNAKIKELKDLDLLIVSLEGPKEIHDSLRGRGTFEKAIESIKAAKKNKLNVWVETVLTAKSNKKLDFLLKKSKEIGFSILFQPVFNYKLAASEGDITRISPEINEYRGLVSKIMRLKKNYKIVSSYSYFRYILKNWPNHVYPHCKAGKLFVSISPSGDVAPCHFLIKTREWPNGIKLGFKKAFHLIKDNRCSGCLCNSYIETNLLFSGNMESKVNFLKNFMGAL